MGFHVLPAHFYSPVPNVGELSKRDWDRKIGESLAFDASKQLDWVRGLQAWNKELADVPAEADASRAHLYHWNNPGFAPLDASVYYAAIRQYQPRRIIEVGGGFSTLIAAQAVRMFPADQRPALTCVEPFPVEALTIGVEGLDRLIGSPVQDVPLHLFDQLEVNDILFIDSSHVSKAASDVNYLILEVLPRLKPGVLVHIHDIFLPWDYPRDWVLNLRNFWNEQYVVHAFLLCNSGFDVLAANWFLSREHRPALVEALPSTPVQSGDSLWLLRRPTRAEG
jgi:predicted O-methyltransferase YrrM